jgi:hypothetical protein
MTEGPRRVYFSCADLQSEVAISNVVHDLYWFPDDERFLYFRYGVGIGVSLRTSLEEQGIEMKKTEMYFYRHPKPAYENDFVRVMRHADVPEWKLNAAKRAMHGRVSLTLAPWRRKEMGFAEAAHVNTQIVGDKERVFEAKPNFYGFSLNLHRLWRVVKRWYKRRHSS